MTVRILLHALDDERLLDQLVGVLEQAVVDDPEHWEKVKDEPGRIDHYGYHNDVLSAVVFSKEPEPSLYYRLAIRPGEGTVHAILAALIIARLTGETRW